MKNVELLNAIIVDVGLPVLTEYALFLAIAPSVQAGGYGTKRFRMADREITRRRFNGIRNELLDERYLRPDPDFGLSSTKVYRVSDVPDGPAEDIAALVDPFCYISHLSAMQRYGLSDRIPNDLCLSTPKAWPAMRTAAEREAIAAFKVKPTYVPRLIRHAFPPNLRRRPVIVHRTVRAPETRSIMDGHGRIAAIGDVFVQMLDRSDLCGGMRHVIEVWERHATTYLATLVEAVDRADEAIIKVRAGYILSEYLSITDDTVEGWVRFAQRGGSRLLDPQRPYASTFSEKWMISLNA